MRATHSPGTSSDAIVDDIRIGGRWSWVWEILRRFYWKFLRPVIHRILSRNSIERIKRFLGANVGQQEALLKKVATNPDASGSDQLFPEISIRAVAEARRFETLNSLVNLCLKSCLDRDHPSWWLHAFSLRDDQTEAEQVDFIRDFATERVLKELGDFETFAKVHDVLSDELGSPEKMPDKFHRELARFAAEETKRIENTFSPATEKTIVLSLVILTHKDAEQFLGRCLPTLQATGNIEALRAQRKLMVLIDVPDDLRPHLNNSAEIDCIRDDITYRSVSGALLRADTGGTTSTLRASLRGFHALIAGAQNADIHFLESNRLYPVGYFASVMRLAGDGEQAIASGSLSANEQAIAPLLAGSFEGNRLAITPGKLTALGLKNLHASEMGLFDAPGEPPVVRFPKSLRFAWRTATEVRLHSTQHPFAYVSGELTARLPQHLIIDQVRAIVMALPPDTAPYMPKAEDGIVYLDLLPELESADGPPEIGMGEYKRHFWDNTDDIRGRLFQKPCFLPLDERDAVTTGTLAQKSDVQDVCETLCDVLGTFQTLRGPAQLATSLHVLKSFEASPYGRGRIERIREEVKSIWERLVDDEESIPTEVRKNLIRSALNYDLMDTAVIYAEKGGSETAFEADYLSYVRGQIQLNDIHANNIRAKIGAKPVSVIGSLVWGPAYVAKYLDYHLASLLAPGNIPALASKSHVILSIVTTDRGRSQIEAHPAYPTICQYMDVHFTIFDENLLERRKSADYNFYFFYGLLDHFNVHFAHQLGANLYLLPVDCMFSNETLANLDRHLSEGGDCCSVSAIESDEAAMFREMDAQRTSNVMLDLPSEQLLETASQHAGRYFRSLVMSPQNRSFSRHPRELVWPVENGIEIHSVFMHPIAISSRMFAPDRDFYPQNENVDYALIPRLLQDDGKLHVLSDAREVGAVHFSPPMVRDDYVGHGFSLRDFAKAHRHDYAIHRDCFQNKQFFPCNGLGFAPTESRDIEFKAIAAALTVPRYDKSDPSAEEMRDS